MEKKSESIWEKDITPGVVAFMTMDITPDFSSPFWTKDITHHVVGTLAVFGLVVSSLVATLGVASAGVNVELAYAQQAATGQTASVALTQEYYPAAAGAPLAIENGSTTPPRPPMMSEHMGSSTAPFCPKIMRTIARGRHEATTTGEVGQLQQFIANHFNLDSKEVVTGHFGSTTEGYLKKFQEEQGIAPSPTVGPLTRAAIARFCNPSGKDSSATQGDQKRDDKGLLRPGNNMGSTTIEGRTKPMPHRDDMMGSTSVERHERPLPPKAPTSVTPPTPVAYYDNSSNAASIVEAMAEVGDGYGKLLTASLKMFGL